jgi:hypothetical protein
MNNNSALVRLVLAVTMRGMNDTEKENVGVTE